MQLISRFIPFDKLRAGRSFGLPLIIALITSINAIATPVLEIENPVFDFGTHDAAAIVTNTFILKNNGDEPLLITETKESCGCTVSDLESKQIPPGKKTALTIRMRLKGMSGPVKKSVHIISNDPERVRSITLKGTAISRVALEPPSLSMGRINPKNPPAPSIVRLGGYCTDAVIKEIYCNTNLFKVVTAEDGRSVTVHPPINQPPGASKQSVIITTSDTQSPKLVLNLFAYTTPPIRFVPRTISVPKKNKESKRYVMLKPGSAGKFALLQAELSSPFAEVKIDPKPKSSYHVILSHINTDLISPESTLKLVTDNPAQPEIIIPVQLLDE